MKKIKNIICIILILMLLATFIPTASYAMGDATGEFRELLVANIHARKAAILFT